MILKLLPYFLLVFILSVSCSEKPKSQKVKNKTKSIDKKEIQTDVEPTPSLDKNENLVKSQESKISNQENKKQTSKTTIKSKTNTINQDLTKKQPKETPKDAYKKESFKIPEEWNDVYSDNPEWIQLFQEAQDAFLKGSDKAFTNNSNLRPSKSQIVQRFERQLEPLFYNTPSFIAFSVERFKNSDGLDSLCRKFNLWRE